MLKSKISSAIGPLLYLAIFAAVLMMFLSGVTSADESQQQEQLRSIERSVFRAVVTCYSIEGRYPDSYEYLAENYGLAIDETKYDVIYSIFGSNIMPDITVVELNES